VGVLAVAVVANYTNSVPPVTETPELAAYIRSGAFANWRGHAIFYRTTTTTVPVNATKPLLLLLHGFPTSSWDWVPMWDALAANFSLLAFDCPGYGLSDKPYRHTYSVRECADVAGDLVASLAPAVRSYHILAHDYGTSVAQELLARAVQQHDDDNNLTTATPASVVLLNGGIVPGAHRPLLVQTLLSNRFVGPLLRPLAVNMFTYRWSLGRVFGTAAPLSPADATTHWALFAHKDGTAIIHRLLGYMAERTATAKRWVGALFDSRAPVAVINGPDDPVSGAHLLAAYAGARATALKAGGMPAAVEAARRLDAVTSLPPGIGHYPQLEAPAAVLAAFSSFHASLATVIPMPTN